MRKSKAQKQAEREVAAKINRAIIGYQIPMLSIPKLYRELEAAVAAGQPCEALKAFVAAFPGVRPSA